MNYIEALTIGFPMIQAECHGDANVYENIEYVSGPTLPSKETLDSWIASNPVANEAKHVTKYEFRKLFTLMERVAIDNFASNPAIPANYKAMLLTLLKDLELSAEVHLDNPDVAAGVNMLEQIGLIGVGRAARILSNLPPLV